MKIGAVYPQTELNGDPVVLDNIGRGVEALGYDHLMMYDHVVGADHAGRNPRLLGPYTDKDPFHDPLVAFAYLAGVTKTIELVTGVLILPQRQTVLVAKQATDVDLLSNGRLRLGVGVGWNYVEYDALGENFADRGKRLTEQIDLLRRLWSEPLLSFNGDFHRFERANIMPRPRRRIPIWCGGFSDPAFRRAARIADGFIFAAGLDLVLSAWEKVKTLLTREDRSLSDFGADVVVQNFKGDALSVQEITDFLRRWQDLGGTHASIVSMGRGFTEPEQHLEFFAQVRHHFVSE